MISYVFSIIDKKLDWAKVLDILSSKKHKHEVILAVDTRNSELDYIKKLSTIAKVLLFEGKSENYMIAEAIKQCQGSKLVLCRDYFEYASVMSDFLIEMGDIGAQVCMFKKNKKKNKLIEFYNKVKNKIISLMFNFHLYDGDIGLMYFGEIAFTVMKETNSVLYTKVNRFIGFEPSYATTDELNKPIIQKRALKKEILKLSGELICLGCLITGITLLICYKIAGFLLGLLFFVCIFMNFFWLLYFILKLDIILKVGDISGK